RAISRFGNRYSAPAPSSPTRRSSALPGTYPPPVDPADPDLPDVARIVEGRDLHLQRTVRIVAASGDVGEDDLEQGAHAQSRGGQDRKSTRLNSSHVKISYAVCC